MAWRAGIFGVGNIAQKAYLPFIVHRTDLLWIGMSNRSSERLRAVGARYPEVPQFQDPDGLIKQGLDVAFVHVSTESHADLTIRLLEAGVSVYVDKPLAYDLREAEQMVEAAERTGRTLMVGYNRRFAPLYIAAREALGGSASFCIAEKHRKARPAEPARETLLDDMIHVIDLLRFFGGGSKAVSADLAVYPDGAIRRGTLEARLSGGGTGYAAMQADAGRDRERFAAYADGVSVEVDEMSLLRIRKGGREEVVSAGKWDTLTYVRGFEGAVSHFLSCVESGRTPDTSGADALETQRLAMSVLEAERPFQ